MDPDTLCGSLMYVHMDGALSQPLPCPHLLQGPHATRGTEGIQGITLSDPPRSGRWCPPGRWPSSRRRRSAATGPCPPPWCASSSRRWTRCTCGACSRESRHQVHVSQTVKWCVCLSLAQLMRPPTARGPRTSGDRVRQESAPDAGGAVEVEEAAGAKVHPLLALAVVVQAELLRLQMRAMPSVSPSAKCSEPCARLVN